MIRLERLSLRRGTQLLFSEASLTLYSGFRVGVTGANGTGKSSLFALIRGELQADTGECQLPPQWVVAHVAQETPSDPRAVLEYVLDGDQALRQIEAAIAAAEAADDGEALAEAHGRYEAAGGYTAPARAARLVHGLGFLPGEEERPVESFSGGWRMRLNLARALMCRSDLLLLDEPTNHLDLDAVIWLEGWLRSYPGTLLLISHDRDFLDQVSDHIAHIEGGRVTLTRGNYSDFERLRAEQLGQQQASYRKQQREITHIRAFVTRFKAKATKARQAQSRVKALERMELIAPAHVDSPFHFSFREPEKLPHPLLRLEGVAAGYGEKTILGGVNLDLVPGQQIGLLGPNGAGKSTLIKLMAGTLQPLEGRRTEAAELKVGYFAQHQLDQLDGGSSAFQQLARLDPNAREQSLRDYLGGFDFRGERVDEPCIHFSGGEKARLVLALLIYLKPNLLLLDEPTNHLDLEMRQALAMALQAFEGAMVVVSHDRHLLRSTTDSLILVHDGGIEPFTEDLEHYGRWLATRSSEARSAVAADEGAGAQREAPARERRERKRLEAEQRKRLQPLKRQLATLEGAMTRLGEEKQQLEKQLASPTLYTEEGGQQLKAVLAEKREVDRSLAETEEEWLAVVEALEELAQEGEGSP